MNDVIRSPRPTDSPQPLAGGPERVWQPLTALRDDMDRLFNGFFRSFTGTGLEPSRFPPPTSALGGVPGAIDVIESEKQYRIAVELPGMSEKDVEIDTSGDLMTIKGEKREQRDEKSENYTLSERRYGKFRRSFQIPTDVDRSGISADFSKGVLTITLPKTAEASAQSRKIEVKAGS